MVTKTLFSNGEQEVIQLAIELMDGAGLEYEPIAPMPVLLESGALDLRGGEWVFPLLKSLALLTLGGQAFAREAMYTLLRELNGLV